MCVSGVAVCVCARESAIYLFFSSEIMLDQVWIMLNMHNILIIVNGVCVVASLFRL